MPCILWASSFGPDSPDAMLIRVWMRTAVRKDIMSFDTFLSTLCHEFCHHLDFQHLGFADSWHTRGFYERAAVLYHHARGTPPKKLFRVPGQALAHRLAENKSECVNLHFPRSSTAPSSLRNA